jgi:hypothetical protein
MTKNFKVGDVVKLWPLSANRKIAEILDINDLGWEFKMLHGTVPNDFCKEGDIVFISHRDKITLVKL